MSAHPLAQALPPWCAPDPEVVRLRRHVEELESRVNALIEERGGLRYDVQSLTTNLEDAERRRLRDVADARAAGRDEGLRLGR